MEKAPETVVILGGSSAIAAGYARAAAMNGDNVVLVGRTRVKLETVMADCASRGTETPVQTWQTCQKLTLSKKFGRAFWTLPATSTGFCLPTVC